MFSKEILKYLAIKIKDWMKDAPDDLEDGEKVKKRSILAELAIDEKDKVNDFEDSVSLFENRTNDLHARLKSCEQNLTELNNKLEAREAELVTLKNEKIDTNDINSKILSERDSVILEKNCIIEEQQKEIELLKNNTASIQPIGSHQKIESKNKTCIVQSLISAGPRKSDRDTELGEDCGGFILKGDELYFWVLDGTSDESLIFIDKIERFSCRNLAVQLSQTISSLLTVNSYEKIDELVDESINNVLNDWQRQVNEEFDHILKNARKINTFKTTLIIGKCTISTGLLQVFRIGDSNLLAFDNQSKKLDVFSEEYKDQVTLQINRDEERFKVRKFDNSDTIQSVSVEGVTTVVVFSDGTSKSTEQEIGKSITTLDNIILNKKQYTQDDKAMIIVQILDL